MSAILDNLVPIAVIVGLAFIYITTYVLNKRTPVPDCGPIKIDTETCTACHNFSCSHKGD